MIDIYTEKKESKDWIIQTLADIPDDVKIRFNDGEVVTGVLGYNKWWEREYARREVQED